MHFLVCNNGASIQYEDNTVTIKDITRDTSCNTYSSLQEVSTKMDDSYNKIILIKDESYTASIIFSNKRGTIDLNGHIINFILDKTTFRPLTFSKMSDMTIESSKSRGGITMDLS